MSREIRVLMVVPNLRVSNGVETYAMNYYRHINHKSVHMDFVTYQNIESPYIKEIINDCNSVFVLPSIKHFIKHKKACRMILEKGNYDILHNNSLMITYPLMKIAKDYVNVRILHSHSARLGETDFNEIRNKLFIPLLVKTANHYAACSSKAAKTLFNNDNAIIIPNVIDALQFKYNEEVRTTVRYSETCESKKVIGTVGRLTDAKNPFFALDIIDKVLTRCKDTEYWWIGSGALDKEVKDKVIKMDNRDRVKLFGSRTDVDKLYQAMDLFFLPSKYEGFGIACLEAQASGLRCIVSEALPNEINVTGKVDFLSFHSPAEEWIGTIIRRLEAHNSRETDYRIINNSVFSVDNPDYGIEKVYREMI